MVQKKVQRKPSAPKKNRGFGPVSTVSLAPVAIGNSIRGTSPHVEMSGDGCRIRGRDFAFAVGSTVAAATDWTLAGGIPVTPCAMPTTALREYCQMYGYFKFNSLAVHYITSSPTTQAGDIVFYYEKDRAGPMIDSTSTSFLPYVLSDVNTVLGPQWTNHTALVRPDPEFKTTDYGMNMDLNEDVNGSVFIFSKTNAANSPGYILFDYDITFKQHQINPRAGLLPVIRAQWTQTCIGQTTVALTSGTTVLLPAFQGNTVAGTVATAPSGAIAGDIYKVIFDVTNSTVTGTNAAWVNATSATLMGYKNPLATINTTTIDDGFTVYAIYSNNTLNLYPTYANAVTGTYAMLAGVTATVTYNICCYVSLVGNVTTRNQSAY